MYDHDIVTSAEVEAAELAWLQGGVPDASIWFRRVEEEVAAGSRTVNKVRQHKNGAVRAGKKIKARNRALKAAKKRKAQQQAKISAP